MNTFKSILALVMLVFSAQIASAQAQIPELDTAKVYVITKNDGTRFIGKILSTDAREIMVDSRTIGMVSIPKHEVKEMRPAQEEDLSVKGKMYIITKNDGTFFTGKIIIADAREVQIETQNVGQVAVPKHEIKEMRPVEKQELSKKGEYKPNETFATRYAISTNGLPLKKGDNYILWNWYGPDIQLSIADNFGVGIITTWLGAPAAVAAKYSMRLDDNTHLAIGGLAGSGSWMNPHFSFALPFASLTFGNRRNNFTVSGGYGAVWNYGKSDGRVLLSIAGMTKISNKASFVFDSFIMPGNGSNLSYGALYIPAIRVQTAYNKAFQIGFAGLSDGTNFAPIPMVQWFRML